MYQYTKPTRIMGTIVLRNEAIHRDRLSQGDGTNCDRRKKSGMAVYGEPAGPWAPSGGRRKTAMRALLPLVCGGGMVGDECAHSKRVGAAVIHGGGPRAVLL